MDYYLLTDMAAQIGYELAAAGAETFRIEETMRRVLAAYGIECEAFAIPNCVMVSLEADNGKPLMVMKRVGFHGNDLDAVERLNALSRRICAETPDPAVAAQWLEETRNDRRSYSVPVYYLGNLLAASGFCPVFGGTLRDSLWAGLMGLIIGFVTRRMDKLETNPFFSTSMRDIIYGDTNSGVNRIVQVLLSALAIAMGTAAAWHITSSLYGQTAASTLSYPFWLQAIAIAVACTGFVILFNVHGWGRCLCALGGVVTWMAYLLCGELGLGPYGANFIAAAVAAVYAEGMARARKYPVTSYQVISAVPLLPGAGIYYTMSLGLNGSTQLALQRGFATAGIAGSIAAAILLVSSVVRLFTAQRKNKAI